MSDRYTHTMKVFGRLKARFPELQARLNEVNLRVQARKLADEAAVNELRKLLGEYQHLTAELRLAASEISVAMAAGLDEMERRLDAHGRELRMAGVVHAYFRLRAESGEIAQALELTKRELMARCANAGEELCAQLQPYSAVVARAQSPDRVLTDEEFGAIYEVIGRKIALASERGQLSMDEQADISGYLDGSSALLRADAQQRPRAASAQREWGAGVQMSIDDWLLNCAEACPGEQAAASADAAALQPQPADGAELPGAAQECKGSSEQADGTPPAPDELNAMDDESYWDEADAPQLSPIWSEYEGYLSDDASIALADDVPAAQLASSVFEKHVRKKGLAMIFALIYAAQTQLVAWPEDGEAEDNGAPSREMIEYLDRQGYFRRIDFCEGGTARQYWTLTSKGWACFAKQKTAALIKRLTISTPLRSTARCDGQWNALLVARLAELSGHVRNLERIYIVSKRRNAISGYCNHALYVPCIFKRGEQDLDDVAQFVDSLDGERDTCKITFVVRSAGDAAIMAKLLEDWAASSGRQLRLKCIRYSLYDRPGETFVPGEAGWDSECGDSAVEPAAENAIVEAVEAASDGAEAEEGAAQPEPAAEVSAVEAGEAASDGAKVEQGAAQPEPAAEVSAIEAVEVEPDSAVAEHGMAQPEPAAEVSAIEAGEAASDSAEAEGDAEQSKPAADASAVEAVEAASDGAEAEEGAAQPEPAAEASAIEAGEAASDGAKVEQGAAQPEPAADASAVEAGEAASDGAEAEGDAEQSKPAADASAVEAGEAASDGAGAEQGAAQQEYEDAFARAASEYESAIFEDEFARPGRARAIGAYVRAEDASASSAWADAPVQSALYPHVEAGECADEQAPDASRIRSYLDGAWSMQLAGRTDAAAVMIKSLVLREPELRMTAEQFACATGDPAMAGKRDSNALQAVFGMPAGSDAAMDALAAAAYLRMYFSYAASEQTYLSRDISHQRDNIALKRYPDLKEAFFKLADWVKYQQRGLDPELMELVLQNHDAGMRQHELQRRAQEMMNRRLTETSHHNNRIKRTRELLFGSGSTMWKLLTAIYENDRSQKLLAEEFAARNADEIIDTTWNEATRQLRFTRNEHCTGVERATLTRQVNAILALVRDWLAASDAKNGVSSEQTDNAEKLIRQLKPMLVSVAGQLAEPDGAAPLAERAAFSALAGAVNDCLERISGESTEEAQARNYYVNLLKEPLVALDDLDMPHIEGPDEETEPFDFCRRAMGYLDAPDRGWDEVLGEIFSSSDLDRVGMDYGCAEVIRLYLELTGQEHIWKPEYSVESAISDACDKASVKRNSVALWEQVFMARLEMADGDNWFDADQGLRSHIHSVLERQKKSYFAEHNFGFYKRAMNRLLVLLHKRAQGLRPRYREEYRKLMDNHGEYELSLPIFAQIRDMIEKDRFGAAESLMQQVRNGNLTIDNGELSSRTLDDFLDRVNSELYRLARLDINKPLATVYQDMHKRRIVNTTQRTGENLTRAWPNGGTLQPERVRTMFAELDQQVADVTGQEQELLVHLQDRGIVMDYPHPIAAFGSIMDKTGIEVAIISGNRDADGLYTEIDKILRRNHTNRPLMLIVNSAITVADRRKLAKKLGRMTSSKPFLLLDRCLALYLADTPKNDRWKTLLRCSLPFRLINPYFENSKMPIPPDMFIGRSEEIKSIIAPDGPNLLYGGRQLGKTAILRRIESRQNRPAEGNWAVYVDVRGMDNEQAVDEIAKELRRGEFLPEDAQYGSWRELLREIERQLMDVKGNAGHTLLLMMDEADNILKLFEDEDFHTLDSMKRLQQTTGGRFKFVLAGLHNVLRFSKKALSGNSVLPHLGGITIQPMKFSDARRLLEEPLSYLGFTIDPGQEDMIAQILHSTNYFPGLIHFYASRLVEHMKEISSDITTPPYRLSRDVLLRMIGDESFRSQRTEKLMMTLTVDERDQDSYYYTLAYALAMCNYNSEDAMLHGASAAEVRSVCVNEYPDCRVGKLTHQQVEALLDELVTFNILRREERGGVRYYMFSRNSFFDMLGNEEHVMWTLMETLDKEAKGQ